MTLRPTRREMLAAALGTGAGVAGLSAVLPRRVVDVLAATSACGGSLKDIEHVVIFIQENRSFDHYFGNYSGVRGWTDATATTNPNTGLPVYAQALPSGVTNQGSPFLYPFWLNTATTNAECTNDITHDWGPQHQAWNNGAMDRFATAHYAADGADNFALTMGYYEQPDLDFYYALANAFTICDGYHCSVIGPTDPNRLYSLTATLDPDGANGGPILHTYFTDRYKPIGHLTWTTMPENLSDAGVSWKVYGNPDGNLGDNILSYFKKYVDGSRPDLTANAFGPTFPGTFQADVAAGTLPQVSWILAPLVYSEHPPAPPRGGEYSVSQVLSALASNPDTWATTALFVTYDENGGFYDHIPPPTAPAGTAGEYLTVNPLPSDASGIAGPIGLGFRVPLLVISPFSRGGLVCSPASSTDAIRTFDHTSLLRFLETRFNVSVPNLSAWRRSVTGDLTAAFNFASAPDTSIPADLPQPQPIDQVVLQQCVPAAALSEITNGKSSPLLPPYPVPTNSTPLQASGTRPAPSGPCATTAATAAATSPAGAVQAGESAQSAGGAQATALPMTAAAVAGSGPVLAAAAALGGLTWIARRRSALAADSDHRGEPPPS